MLLPFLKALSWYVFAPILFHIRPEFLCRFAHVLCFYSFSVPYYYDVSTNKALLCIF